MAVENPGFSSSKDLGVSSISDGKIDNYEIETSSTERFSIFDDSKITFWSKTRLLILALVIVAAVVVAIIVGVVVGTSDNKGKPEIEKPGPLNLSFCERVAPFGLFNATPIQNWEGGTMIKVKYKNNLVPSCKEITYDNEVNISQSGVYLFSISGASLGKWPFHLEMVDVEAKPYAMTLRNTVDHESIEILSRTILAEIKAPNILKSQCDGACFDRYSYLHSTWAGINLDVTLNFTLAFSKEKTTSQTEAGPISFDRHLVNRTRYPETYLEPSVPGLYLICLSIGINSDVSSTTQVSLRINSDPALLLHYSNRTHENLDTMSTCTLMELEQGDTVMPYLDYGYIQNSEDEVVTSFSGFLYEPNLTASVAWSLYRLAPWDAIPGPPYEPVSFDVSINIGEAFNKSSNNVTLPYTGIYYIHVSVGVPMNRKTFIQIIHNGENIGSVAKMGAEPSSTVISRGLILEGREGDRLVIRSDTCPDCGFYSSEIGKEFSFTGLLLSPIPT